MNREEYIEHLRKQNGYCDCPGLADLFEKRKKASALEAKCNFFKGNVNLDQANSGDLPFLEDYKKNIDDLKESINKYHSTLTGLASRGKIKLILHDSQGFYPLREISLESDSDLLDEKDSIATIHCSRCDQQIDLYSQ